MRFDQIDPAHHGKVVDATAAKESRRAEMGWLGVAFGSTAEKAGNIAGFTIVFAAIAIASVIMWMPETQHFTKKDAVLIFVSLITLALGYLFGRGSKVD